eukprot:3225658-Rhodomonas_salina.1
MPSGQLSVKSASRQVSSRDQAVRGLVRCLAPALALHWQAAAAVARPQCPLQAPPSPRAPSALLRALALAVSRAAFKRERARALVCISGGV